jgi:hypothetical protein
MKKFKVIFETFCTISIEVEANNEDEAKEKASEQVCITELAPQRGYGAMLSLEGENNFMYIDSENMYDRISEVEKI